MKTFAAVIGTLTLAQWVFIGLLHGFLTVQHKRSPETLTRLHKVPVIGGYFIPPHEESDVDKINEEQAQRSLRIVEAKEVFDLPPAFDQDELKKLVDEVRSRKEQLHQTRQDIDERETRVGDLEREIERREKAVAMRQEEVEKKAQEVSKVRAELDADVKAHDVQKTEAEQTILKKLAKIYGELEPSKAAAILSKNPSGDDGAAGIDERAMNAAKVLTYMEPDKSAKILESLDAIEAVRIAEKMKELAMKK